jgi:hypothetical protein
LPQGICAEALVVANAPATIVAEQARASFRLRRENMHV